jgi:DHA2 family methylenomycin A resistance protein-like MFS transporter
LAWVNTRSGDLAAAALIIPVGAGLAFALPALTNIMLNAVAPEQAGMAAGLFNSSRQAGGALAVAVFGALVSHRVSFGSGMRTSLLIAAALVLATTAAALALPGQRTGDLT